MSSAAEPGVPKEFEPVADALQGDLAAPGEDASGMGTDVERLSRWLAAGGGWRVIVRTPSSLTVALLTCDGGEEMDRIVSSDSSFVDCVSSLEASKDNQS